MLLLRLLLVNSQDTIRNFLLAPFSQSNTINPAFNLNWSILFVLVSSPPSSLSIDGHYLQPRHILQPQLASEGRTAGIDESNDIDGKKMRLACLMFLLHFCQTLDSSDAFFQDRYSFFGFNRAR